MTNPGHPHLKSTTPTPDRAEYATPTPATHRPRAPEKRRPKGGLSVLRPDLHPAAGPHPVAWLHITAPGRGTVPSARSVCVRGRDRSAIGQGNVAGLIQEHDQHRAACPARTGIERERRSVA